MHKIKLIILREYTTRVRKKAFIIMTFLGPVLFAALMILPIWLSQIEDQDTKTIAIIECDANGIAVPESNHQFRDVIPDTKKIKFKHLNNISEDEIEKLMDHTDYFGFLVLNHKVFSEKENIYTTLYGAKQPSLGLEMHIRRSLEKYVYDKKLSAYKIPKHVIQSAQTEVSLITVKLENGEFKQQTQVNVRRGIGYASSFLIYMFIFFFGSQVMRGVIEEKTNRIVEVVITSVRPFQLMAGKIIGIGLVGLTQFLAWAILTFGIFQFVNTNIYDSKMEKQNAIEQPNGLFDTSAQSDIRYEPSADNMDMTSILKALKRIDYSYVLSSFVFFFVGGFLLYGSMFAAIGSAVDSETDTQQFMLPVTIPLISGVIIMLNAITNPEGDLAYWFSMIPFTSPIVMMARVPFNVPRS